MTHRKYCKRKKTKSSLLKLPLQLSSATTMDDSSEAQRGADETDGDGIEADPPSSEDKQKEKVRGAL
jgi:hypothetical protein